MKSILGALSILLILYTQNIYAHPEAKKIKCNHGKLDKIHRIKQRKPVKLKKLNKPLMEGSFESSEALAPLPNFKVDFKILLLSATNNPDIEPSFAQAKKAFQSMGIPYEHRYLTNNGNRISTGPLNLVNADGSGKYYGVVVSTGELAYEMADHNWDSALTPDQWTELNDYELNYSIRHVSLYSYPTDSLGTQLISENGNPNYLLFTSESSPWATGIPSTAKPPLSETWLYPSKIINANIAKTFLMFKNSTVAASTAKMPDGRLQLHFYFDQSIYSLGSQVIAPVWVKWLTRGAFVGKRRIYLVLQIDDLFLASDLWDPATNTTPEDGSRIYRIKEADVNSYLDYQNATLRSIAINNNFRTEFAYNGEGVIDNGGYNNDNLFKRFKATQGNWNFVTHTWDHEDMTNQTYAEATTELTKNYVTAQNLGVWNAQNFSKNSIVTPGISGLFNGNVLQALFDQQIIYTVGDNSRPELMNSNPYLPLRTTLAVNGFDNIVIIPRHATQVFYNTSTKNEMVSEYNFFYRDFFGLDSTFAQIMKREEDVTVNALLAFDPAPWMFHQANMRRFQQNSVWESLLSLWMKQITNGVRKYSNLPILNLKMNDLKDVYLARESYEGCNFKGQIEVTNFQMTKITAASTKACPVSLTGVRGTAAGATQETYGPDTTMNLSLDGVNAKVITLSPAIPVNN